MFEGMWYSVVVYNVVCYCVDGVGEEGDVFVFGKDYFMGVSLIEG